MSEMSNTFVSECCSKSTRRILESGNRLHHEMCPHLLYDEAQRRFENARCVQ